MTCALPPFATNMGRASVHAGAQCAVRRPTLQCVRGEGLVRPRAIAGGGTCAAPSARWHREGRRLNFRNIDDGIVGRRGRRLRTTRGIASLLSGPLEGVYVRLLKVNPTSSKPATQRRATGQHCQFVQPWEDALKNGGERVAETLNSASVGRRRKLISQH